MTKNIKTKFDKIESIREKFGVLTPGLALRTSFLSQWDIVTRPTSDEIGETGFHSMRSSDNDMIIGKPFNPLTYFPVPNGKFMDVIESALTEYGHKIALVGSASKRTKTFATVLLDDMPQFKAGKRTFEPYLGFLNSFNGSTTLTAVTGSWCLNCLNQIASIIRSRGKLVKINVKHTKGAPTKIDNIGDIVAAAIETNAEFAKVMIGFEAVKLTAEDALNILAGFIAPNQALQDGLATKTENEIETLFSLFRSGNGNTGTDLSDVFNAITDRFTHGGSESRIEQSKVHESALFGEAANKKNLALDLFQDLAEVEKLRKRGEKVRTIERKVTLKS